MRVPRLLKHFFGFVLLAALVPAQAQPSSRRLDLTTQQSQPSVDAMVTPFTLSALTSLAPPAFVMPAPWTAGGPGLSTTGS